jgi:exonuclease SbcC
VTAEQEDAAKATVDAARAALQEAERALADTERALAAATAVAGEEPLEALTAAAAEAQATADATARIATGAAEAALALERFAGERARAEQARSAAAEAHAGLAARVAELRAAQEADTGRLEQALAGARSVAARVQALEGQATANERAAAATERAAAAATEAHEAAVRVEEAAVAAGFADGAEAAAAVLTAGDIAALEGALRRHAEGLAERRALVADPALMAAVTAPAPDEAGAMAVARAAAEADAEASQALERVRGRAEKLLVLRRELERRLAAHGPAAAAAATVRGIATLVDGTSSQNRKRMRLRAYVLAARLEEIATAASGRLALMSDGRYTLTLDDERASHNRRSGLGLRVVDEWTGRDRHPSSLSGGETFQASLALALGLADVVAAEAGGARLETLFVDEGFGSLDERALDNALEVLDRLREGGRAVGVVSHVAELRQRITAQVHVVKDREGSRVLQTV